MIDRIRLALKVLFVPKIIVITKGENFTTFNNSRIIQDSNHIIVEVPLRKEE